MFAVRRPALITVLVLALSPAGGALALDQADVAELEGLLRNLGFDPGAVDGVVDADTIEAIRRYQDFALLPGPPEPTAQLLDELRGVAAAYSALNADRTAPSPAENEAAAEPAPEDTADKAVVPPPAPPLKLTPEVAPDAPVVEAEESTAELGEDATAVVPPEVATEPPADADQVPADEVPPRDDTSPPEATAALPPVAAQPPAEEASAPEVLSALEATVEPADSDEASRARIDAELLRFHHQLSGGSLTREDLARQFNAEGRKLLQQADYGAAILKFSVAIHLDPDFAGAYSNRGTAYRLQDEPGKAEADFDKAKDLGFGGLRLKDAKNPLR